MSLMEKKIYKVSFNLIIRLDIKLHETTIPCSFNYSYFYQLFSVIHALTSIFSTDTTKDTRCSQFNNHLNRTAFTAKPSRTAVIEMTNIKYFKKVCTDISILLWKAEQYKKFWFNHGLIWRNFQFNSWNFLHQSPLYIKYLQLFHANFEYVYFF